MIKLLHLIICVIFAELCSAKITQINNGSAYEGSGIGLSVCYRIVERRHGSTSAEGAVGMGAEFFITLSTSQAA